MNEIIKSNWIAEDIKELWFRNPLIAGKFQIADDVGAAPLKPVAAELREFKNSLTMI